MTKRISLKYSSEVYFGHYHRRVYKAGPHDFGIEKIEAEKARVYAKESMSPPGERLEAKPNTSIYPNAQDFFGDRKNFGIEAGKFKSDDDVDLRWPDKDRIQAIANLMRLEMQTRIHAQMSCTRRHFFRLRVLNCVFPGKNVKHLGSVTIPKSHVAQLPATNSTRESGIPSSWLYMRFCDDHTSMVKDVRIGSLEARIVVQSGARGPGRLGVLCISGNESSMCCGSVDLGFSLEVKMIRRNPNLPPYILTWIIGIRYQNGGHGCTTSQEPRGNTSREERKTMKCLSYRLPVVAESSNGETLFLGASHELRSAE
ncbi:hypothetical protein EDD18DRAFT_1338839 [Armillaria luteobubalina]|uniref:Uncharacterized protein n=1 Tax=Armillaria luteobubalina TaxID=153913 RepID=A0AA39U6V4_9AGAR|nr:hypothetical protein EDD18DRAFT_1338839 [Armillaria luteobubalina]